MANNVETLNIHSDAFKDRAFIPSKYTCDGQNINPPLYVRNIPGGTQSFVLLVEDPDGPIGPWIHWVVWNINPSGVIKEKSIPGIEGMNDFRKHHYGGPCPPSGLHRYIFKMYALDTMLSLGTAASFLELEKAMTPHIIGYGEIIGLYKRI